MVSYDIETKRYYDTDLGIDITKINWIDDYLLWENVDNNVVVRDFDGSNRRGIAKQASPALPAVISENNDWLYYFEIPTETIEETDAGQVKSITINLKREKLQ